MLNKKLIFYNNFHNGDIHVSRDFVKDIVSKINFSEAIYYHENSYTILKDIEVKHVKEKYGSDSAKKLPILYGGSCKP